MNVDPGKRSESSRLYWQCRRGMLELDLLLRGFLDARGGCLDAGMRETFERLLQYPDAVLLEYLMGRMQPTDMEVAQLVRAIRTTAAP